MTCVCVHVDGSATDVRQMTQPPRTDSSLHVALVHMLSAATNMASAIAETLHARPMAQHTDATSGLPPASVPVSQVTHWSAGNQLLQGTGASVSGAVGSALNYLNL